MKWVTRIAVVLVVVLAGGWIFRAELALFGVKQMLTSQVEIARLRRSLVTGVDPQGRSAQDRPPNIVLILADDLSWNDLL